MKAFQRWGAAFNPSRSESTPLSGCDAANHAKSLMRASYEVLLAEPLPDRLRTLGETLAAALKQSQSRR
jgi:hypothetical protein